jgi:hypothetical protein
MATMVSIIVKPFFEVSSARKPLFLVFILVLKNII